MNIENASNFEKSRAIYDITKFTHLDYPDHLACIFWFKGCNMRCDYCYNEDIVFAKEGHYSLDDALKFLHSRINLLDAVVLSGGEATLHKIIEFVTEIKSLGFLVKLDTNGSSFKNIKTLVEKNLVDYIALDYKAPKKKFQAITHTNRFEEFSQTLDFLLKSSVEFEVRTTLHTSLLNEDDINLIIKDLSHRGYNRPYYIQEFLKTKSNMANLEIPTKAFNKETLASDLEIVWR